MAGEGQGHKDFRREGIASVPATQAHGMRGVSSGVGRSGNEYIPYNDEISIISGIPGYITQTTSSDKPKPGC